jgi:hypothetical protein
VPAEKPSKVALSKYEAEIADKIADMFEITREEAVSRVVRAGIARRMKRNTGKTPAKVYRMPTK